MRIAVFLWLIIGALALSCCAKHEVICPAGKFPIGHYQSNKMPKGYMVICE